MPSFCVVSNCEFKYSHSNNVSFHKFPFHNPDILDAWIAFTGRGSNWMPSRWSAICSRHFLPKDFRDYVYRKCLKRTAIPTIYTDIYLNYPEQYETNVRNSNNNNTNVILPSKTYSIICRLCGVSSLDWNYEANDIDNGNIMILISKCFPNISLDRMDNMPSKICINCITKLKEFSHFVDIVITVQNELHLNVLNETSETTRHDDRLSKPSITIKQEPVVNVKQEILDSNRMSSNPIQNSNTPLLESTESSYVLDALMENDAFCEKCDANFLNNVELKKHIVNFHSSDHREIANNCEIMEIITLENGCIDLVIEEEENIEPYETNVSQNSNGFKTESTKEQNLYNFRHIFVEHSYSKQTNESEIQNSESTIETNQDSFKQEDGSIKMLAKVTNAVVEPTKAITILICSQCNSQFDCQQKFYEHIDNQHSNETEQETQFKCLKCLKLFETKMALSKHKLSKCFHSAGLMFKCRYCNIRFRKWRNIKRHSVRCSKVYRTLKRLHRKPAKIITLKRSQNNQTKSSWKSLEEQTFSCDLCGRSYNRRCNLYRHIRMHRPKTDWDQKCRNCGNSFDKPQDLKKHFTRNECNSTFDFVDYKCKICSKKFHRAKNLYQHQLTHSTDRNYKCKLCPKVFKRLSGLNQHNKGFHEKIKPYKCDVCDHYYALKGDMKRCQHSILKQQSW